MILGDLACFALGTLQFMKVTDSNPAVALSYCVVPFVIPDIVKIAVAVLVINRVRKYVRVFN